MGELSTCEVSVSLAQMMTYTSFTRFYLLLFSIQEVIFSRRCGKNPQSESSGLFGLVKALELETGCLRTC